MLHHFLSVAAIIIVIDLQHTTCENGYNDRPQLRDGKQHKKNGIMTLRKSSSFSDNQLITESRNEKVSNFRSDQQAMNNFKQPPKHDSSNIIHTQKKPPKQKVVGVPAGTLASGYFLVSAWTDVGCTGKYISPSLCQLSFSRSFNSSHSLNLMNVQVW